MAVFDGVELLDVAGPLQVFSAATRVLGPGLGYETLIVGPAAGPVRCAGGTQLIADVSWSSRRRHVDTLIVAGGLVPTRTGMEPLVVPSLINWLRTPTAQRSGRIASVCAGAHLLAAAGILDGRQATTHWATTDKLASAYPDVAVDPDAIFVRDGKVWTSAGVSSGMDLALAMVAEDHGPELARSVARWLVMYLQRPGGQTQFSALLAHPSAPDTGIGALQRWLPDHLDADLSVAALARRAHLSVRHFSRQFREQVGVTPHDYVENMRVEAAALLLLQTTKGLTAIAAEVGLGSVETLHRVFHRRFGISPGAYRQRFTLSPSPAGSVAP